jgi:hypothetical protein
VRVETRVAYRSTAFEALSPTEKLTRLIALFPKQAAALVGLMDEIYLKQQRLRKRQARAELSAAAPAARSGSAR